MIRSVTVITPTYNALSWLRACRSSVMRQTFPSIQHIIVDGGSTDGTVDWLREQPDVEWTSEPDRGQSDALAKGFASARGELLCWLNADDRFAPDACAIAVACAERDRADVVLGACLFADAEGRPIRVVFGPRRLRLADLANDLPINQPSTFFTAKAYESVGGIDVSKHLAMDHDLWMRMAHGRWPVTATNRVLSAFTVRDTSKTGVSAQTDFVRETQASMASLGELPLARYMAGRLAATEELDRNRVGSDVIAYLATMLRGHEGELRGAGAELVRRSPYAALPRLVSKLIGAPASMRAGGARMLATKAALVSRQRLLAKTTARHVSIEP